MIKNQNINTLILQTEDHWEQVGTDDFYFIFSYLESIIRLFTQQRPVWNYR